MKTTAPRPDSWNAILGHAPQAHRKESREGRVEMIGAAASALIEGRMPDTDARFFVAGALLAWLSNGGSLEKDFFKVVRPKSHTTPAAVWRQLQAEKSSSSG